jgi:transcriptional regulator with XRE-family HTH domain
MGELKDMMDLRESRNRAKKTQAMLSVATGLDQGYLSRVESGERSLSPATAKKLAAALKNTNAATLVFSNRSAMLQRAVDRGDVAGAIEAAKSAYKTAEANGWTDDDDGDEALSELLDAATKFVESAASGTYEDEEVYGHEADQDVTSVRRRVEVKQEQEFAHRSEIRRLEEAVNARTRVASNWGVVVG